MSNGWVATVVVLSVCQTEKLPYVTSGRLTHRQGERGAGWIANDTGDFER